jgi:predicted metallopeptidase
MNKILKLGKVYIEFCRKEFKRLSIKASVKKMIKWLQFMMTE